MNGRLVLRRFASGKEVEVEEAVFYRKMSIELKAGNLVLTNLFEINPDSMLHRSLSFVTLIQNGSQLNKPIENTFNDFIE